MNHPTTIIVMYVAKHTDGDGGNMTCMQCHACTWCLSVSLETIEIITLLYVCLSLVVKAYVREFPISCTKPLHTFINYILLSGFYNHGLAFSIGFFMLPNS